MLRSLARMAAPGIEKLRIEREPHRSRLSSIQGYILILVPRRGLEPPRPYGHQHLKLARLPIPPPGPVRKRRAIRLGAGDVNSGHEAPATGAFLSSAAPPVHDGKDQVSGQLRNVGAAHQMRAKPEPLRNPGQWPLTPPSNPALPGKLPVAGVCKRIGAPVPPNWLPPGVCR